VSELLPAFLSRSAATIAGTREETNAEFARGWKLAATMRMSHAVYPVLARVRSVRASHHHLVSMIDAPPAPWTGPRRIPTPTIWPHLAADLVDENGGLLREHGGETSGEQGVE
jgi:hypothetical protein